MKTKILVTGGVGFIGAHLTDLLIKKKYQVMVVDNLSTIGGIKYVHPKCNFIKGDITSKRTLNSIKRWQPKIIFHLAAQSAGESAYDNPKNDFISNGYGTFELVKLAKELNVKKFIYTSSVAVYGSNPKKIITEDSKINPDSIYGISKYVGEMFIKQILYKSNVNTLILRLLNTYGPGEDLNYEKKGQIKIYSSYVWKRKPIIVKGSKNRFRNFNYIEDVIKILFLSINNKKLDKNETINLTNGKKVFVRDALKKILKVNKLKKYKIIQQGNTKGDSFGYHASNKRLKKKFDKLKFTTLDQGLSKFFTWIKDVPVKKDIKNYHPLKMSKKYGK